MTLEAATEEQQLCTRKLVSCLIQQIQQQKSNVSIVRIQMTILQKESFRIYTTIRKQK